MFRRFTKDLGRFRKGELRDYPMRTWRAIAKTQKLESFSEAVPQEAGMAALGMRPARRAV